MEENKKANNTLKIVIITIVVMIIIAIIGRIVYEFYEDYKWDKYRDKYDIYDNLLNAECGIEEDNQNIVSCYVNSSVPTSEYDYYSINIHHSKNLKYLSYEIPNKDNLYITYETSTHYNDDIRERFFVTGISEVPNLEYLLNVKFELSDDILPDEKLNFDYMSLVNGETHHYANEIVININNLLENNTNE